MSTLEALRLAISLVALAVALYALARSSRALRRAEGVLDRAKSMEKWKVPDDYNPNEEIQP